MNKIIPFHGPTSTGSRGYKSGRNSCRDTPDIRSTARTRSGGTSVHCDTACMVMPSGDAKPSNPPAASIARLRAFLLPLFMVEHSNIASLVSQARLHCAAKAALYDVGMTLGKRIKLARERLEPKPRQQDIANKLGITDKAVSSWERDQTVPEPDRLPELRRLLRVTYSWLLEGRGPPPAPDDPEVLFDDLLEAERAAVKAMIAAFLKQRSNAA